MIDRRRFLRTVVAGAALSLAAPSLAWAAEVEVKAVLGRPQVEVGQSVYLQVEVSTSGSGSVGTPRFPGLEGVEISARGSSSGVSVEISGMRQVRRVTKTFTYVVSPKTAGEHVIQVEVEVGGKVYPAPHAPRLVGIGAETEAEAEPEQGKAGDQPASASADVIVWPVVDKAKVYVGEQIIYDLQIWQRSRGNLSFTSAPTFKDFWSEDLDDQEQLRRRRQSTELLEGTPYRVHHAMRRALFPQKTGTLTIGGPEVQEQAMVGPFFGGTGPPRNYTGRSLAIEVMPLPSEGKPAGFRPSNVGRFRIASEVDRTQVRQGEAVRLTVRISGTGNIALVELPALPELEGLRSYEPKPETPKLTLGKARLSGSRVFTMLVVADEAGTLTIPPIELPYFEPETAKYGLAKTKPITLEVEADADAPSPPRPASEGDEGDEDELLAPPIAGQTLTRVTPRERWLSPERWWLGSLAAPTVLGLGWLGARLRQRYGPDDAARARSKELARRRELLNQANAAVAEGENFYPTLASLLQTAAVIRAGSDGVGLAREQLMKLLTKQGVAADEVSELSALLDAADAARFGAGSGDASQRREHLERARALLARRSWRPG